MSSGECKPNCLNRIVKIDLSEIDLNFNQLTLSGKCSFQAHCCKYLGTYWYKLSTNGNAYMLRKSRHARLTYVNLFQQLMLKGMDVIVLIEQKKVRKYRRDNQKWTNDPSNIGYTRRRQTSKHNTICVGHHFTQANTNNVNKI